MKILKVLFCIFISFCIFAIIGCNKTNELKAIKNRGIILVGTTGDYRPMSYFEADKNEYIGFDIALAEDLAKKLGVKTRYVHTSWQTLMEDTVNRKFDVALSGITITEARKKNALMSNGYLTNGKTILCRSEDKDKYTSLEAVNNPKVRVMENPGGLNEKFALENLPNAKLIIHPINEEIPELIAIGAADVMITEVMEARYYSQKDKRLSAPIADFPFTQGEIGMLIPKENVKLLEYVNNFLKEQKNNNRINELIQKYIYNN